MDALPKDIHDPKASKPAEAVLQLNKLFEIEKELDTLPPEQKKKERLTREKTLLEAFWPWAEISSAGELPKSKLHTAIHYALNNRQEFFNYLEDGNCSISNSLAKNCIRPFVIGRKNWLFAVSPKGAAASAGIYTLVETAKANGLDAVKYIKYILSDQICQGVHSLKTQNIWMTIYHGTPWYRNVADNHCPFSIEGWWLFFYPLSYLTLTFQRPVNFPADVRSGQPTGVKINLGIDHNLITGNILFQRPAQIFLAGSGGVAIGRIKEIDTEIQGVPDKLLRIPFIQRTVVHSSGLAKAHTAHTQFRDLNIRIF